MTERFFCRSDEFYKEFTTEQEAKDAATELLHQCRIEARNEGEWPEEVDSIIWGKILGVTMYRQESESCGDYYLASTSAELPPT